MVKMVIQLLKRTHDQLVSGWLTTYPSPKSQFCPKWEVSVNVDLREGQVVSYQDIDSLNKSKALLIQSVVHVVYDLETNNTYL